jgi:hypothetical protein
VRAYRHLPSVSAAEPRSAGRARVPVPTRPFQNSGQGTGGHGSASHTGVEPSPPKGGFAREVSVANHH